MGGTWTCSEEEPDPNLEEEKEDEELKEDAIGMENKISLLKNELFQSKEIYRIICRVTTYGSCTSSSSKAGNYI